MGLLATAGCRDFVNVTISNWAVLHGEGASCPEVAEWVTETLSSIRARYSNKNLYNLMKLPSFGALYPVSLLCYRKNLVRFVERNSTKTV